MSVETAILVGLSRQVALKRQMEVVANNIANMNTTAYRAESILFREYLVTSPTGDKVSYVEDYGIARDLREGAMEATSNSLDVAISGPGYFVVEGNDGPRYTRNGHLRLDDEGQLVTQDGAPLQDRDGQVIQFENPTVEVTISRDGTITAADGESFTLAVVSFDNEQALQKAANGLYKTDQAPTPVEAPQILQGMLEASNVQPIVQMTRLIDIQRAYEGTQKMMNADHDLQRDAIGRIGRVS
ncbi:MAG: flagellar basal-body rod protein FlgF [Pseudomonadota bacterium]|nr:flagellar basal-body rod protein FlgF [Pseudomonadota bacterium]